MYIPSCGLNLEHTKSILFKSTVSHIMCLCTPNNLLPPTQNFPWPFSPQPVKTKLLSLGVMDSHIFSLVKFPNPIWNSPAICQARCLRVPKITIYSSLLILFLLCLSFERFLANCNSSSKCNCLKFMFCKQHLHIHFYSINPIPHDLPKLHFEKLCFMHLIQSHYNVSPIFKIFLLFHSLLSS